jgi:two-component system, NtrC family, sensor kinase
MGILAQLKKILFVFILIIFSVLIIMFNYNIKKVHNQKLSHLEKHWEYSFQNKPGTGGAFINEAPEWKPYNMNAPEVRDQIFKEFASQRNSISERTLWLKLDIPDEVMNYDNPAVYFENIYAQSLIIYLGDKPVYTKLRNWMTDINKIFLPLKYSMPHQTILIKLNTVEEFGRIGPTQSIYIGDQSKLLDMYLNKNSDSIFIGVGISILGIFMLFASFFVHKQIKKSWLPLSFIILLIGITIALYPNNLGAFYPDLEKHLMVLLEFFKFGGIVFLIYFFEQIFGSGNKGFIRKLWQIHVVLFLFGVLAILTDNYILHFTSIFLIILKNFILPVFLAIDLITLTMFTIRNFIKGNRDSLFFCIGFSTFLFCIVLDVLISCFIYLQYQPQLFKLGSIILIVMLATILGRRIADNYNRVISYSKELEEKNSELDMMWNEVKVSRDRLEDLNKTLEQHVKERTQELQMTNKELTLVNEELYASNSELTSILDILRKTQAQLIESEKLAALGQLVAGVAHEINTPIGAIKASIENISHYLNTFMDTLPCLSQILLIERRDDFFKLLQNALNVDLQSISTREERELKRALIKKLSDAKINEPEKKADMLVTMGVYDIEHYKDLLNENESDAILETAFALSALQRSTTTIKTATERTSKIIFALRSYSHFDQSSQKAKISIKESLEIILTLYNNKIKNGVSVIRNFKEVDSIMCYPDELHQVWTNLISNALQAMNYNGTLTLDISQKGSDVVVSISDSGTGIPDENKNRIFEPFFTTKPIGEGSGLGLDIVKRIVEKHNGRIDFMSVPGNTVFSVYLPV